MAANVVMTLRIDPALLDALRRRAKRDGRSVSAEVVQLIRKELDDVHVPNRRAARRTMGMFADSDFEVLELEDFKRLRRRTSMIVARRIARSRRSS
jgi:hypothetical protein